MRFTLALYPRWWRDRYGREMDALLEDAGSGWPAVFDLARGAAVVRIEESMKRASIETAGLWIGRNALGLAVFWLLGFALIRAGLFPGVHAAMIGRFIAFALGAAISYKLRASFMTALLATLAGFYGSWLIFTPVFGEVALYEGNVALYERPSIDVGRMAVSIVVAALVWWVVRRSTRRMRAA